MQAQFAKGIADYLRSFEAILRADAPAGNDAEHRATAAALLTQAVGAIVLSRAVADADPALSEGILAGARGAVAKLIDAPPPKRRR